MLIVVFLFPITYLSSTAILLQMEPEYNSPASSLSDYDDPSFEEIVKNNTFEGSYSVNNSNDVATIPTAPEPEEICTSSYATMMNEWMQQGSFINTSIHWLLITSISTDPITALHAMHAICAHYNIKVRFSRDTNYVAHCRLNDEGDIETFPCHLDIMLSIHIYITAMRLSSDTTVKPPLKIAQLVLFSMPHKQQMSAAAHGYL